MSEIMDGREASGFVEARRASSGTLGPREREERRPVDGPKGDPLWL